MQRQGRFVEMLGDRINGILSIKQADLGIAIQTVFRVIHKNYSGLLFIIGFFRRSRLLLCNYFC